MSTKRVYIDTSAYIAVLLGTPEGKEVLAAIGNRVLCSSVLLLIETERNLVRLSREQVIEPAAYQTCIDQLTLDKEAFILRDVTPDLCLTGRFPAVRLPRSSDLIHLRTALWFQEGTGLDRFISCDENQAGAAEELGIFGVEYIQL